MEHGDTKSTMCRVAIHESFFPISTLHGCNHSSPTFCPVASCTSQRFYVLLIPPTTLMASQRSIPPAHLAHFVSGGLTVYFLEQGIFRIDLQDFPHRQWVPLSSTIHPNDLLDHSSWIWDATACTGSSDPKISKITPNFMCLTPKTTNTCFFEKGHAKN